MTCHIAARRESELLKGLVFFRFREDARKNLPLIARIFTNFLVFCTDGASSVGFEFLCPCS